jgi:hypothetical protein
VALAGLVGRLRAVHQVAEVSVQMVFLVVDSSTGDLTHSRSPTRGISA